MKFNYTKQVTVYNVAGHQCQGYFKHFHRTEYGAIFCQNLQMLLPMLLLHHWWLKRFNLKKYQKILVAMKGSNKRALIRRKKKGMKAI